MKLYEIARKDSGSSYETITVDTEGYGKIKVKVEYDWENATSDRHGDNSSFDEYHAGGFDISKITLAEPVKEFDDDGEPTDKTWPKGTDVSKLKYWDEKFDEKTVEKELDKYFKDRDDD